MSLLSNFINQNGVEHVPTHGSCLIVGSPESVTTLGLAKALEHFSKTVWVTKHRWSHLPNHPELPKIISLMGLDSFKFVYPKDYDQLVRYLAALSAKTSGTPDLLIVDKLEDFVLSPDGSPDDDQTQPAEGAKPTSRTKTSRYECHRRTTKVMALLATFSSSSAQKDQVRLMGPPDPSKGSSVLVGLGLPKTHELTLSELDMTRLWFHEAWSSLQIPTADGVTVDLTCHHGPLKDHNLKIKGPAES